ncbi:hypothetical protein C2W62_39270 [Candidatus Entotheonella serta]|nr:hypothetical protein C2W62_39270 [Candidatus Entotheonella serta]
MGLGTEIKKARIDKGLQGKELAAMIDIAPKYLSQIENDKAPGLTVVLLQRLCNELDVTPNQLLQYQTKD